MPHAALSVMPDDRFAAAATPLLEADLVDALLWSPDVGFGRELPEWCTALLDLFAGAGRLTAHGVSLSPFSVRFTDRQREWLALLAEETRRRRYVRVSEHVGFTTAGAFDRGAPMPVPLCTAALEAARANLDRLRDATGGLPVGFENLALAFSRGDVDAQGVYLSLGDFAVLDLHNLYCAAVNFGPTASGSREAIAMLETLPLAKVREIHLAGGRWSHPVADPEKRAFRRDTHDGAVPEPVFALLGEALARCPNVDMVVLEALPESLAGEQARERFREDFRTMREIAAASRPAHERHDGVRDDRHLVQASLDELDAYQRALLHRLHEGIAPSAVRDALLADAALIAFHPYLRDVQPRTLEVAIELAGKWGRREAVPAHEAG